MSEEMLETFDTLLRTVYRQGQRIDGLEQRVADLERKLNERPSNVRPFPVSDERELIEVI